MPRSCEMTDPTCVTPFYAEIFTGSHTHLIHVPYLVRAKSPFTTQNILKVVHEHGDIVFIEIGHSLDGGSFMLSDRCLCDAQGSACNGNCANRNNMTHTQARHTRALRINMQHDVHVSRNGANYNNLINVQSNKWDLPTVINTNIRGALASKIDEIKVIKDNYGVDVLAVTETWCTCRIPDGSLSLPGFNLYRRDRQDGRQHGGIVCYVRDTIPTKQWT